MYLDYAELQAERGIAMYMRDWVKKLDAFLRFNEHEILNDARKISYDVAEALAIKEYEIYKKQLNQLIESDFDRVVKNLLEERIGYDIKKGEGKFLKFLRTIDFLVEE